ncbi:hypothetical protein [Solirubrum puertoriconensis]|uniref:Outer membrane protein beta-barrel domain-containing protein n=1 Tax=Solirubrum puertoriconensis TaxID=1751427 RepID=A0A9X0L680_SOLP1|nr:hypothetical protein [Solirubrum puertoriconensis]KUG09440.1 hypothetical protein ASU33_17075 [Solirubrum puertoriconensis]
MNKPAIILLLLALSLPVSWVSAQSKKSSSKSSGGNGGSGYKTAIGLRGGNYASGLTIKHFTGGNNVAIEGLITTEYYAKGVRGTLLFEKHFPLKDLRGFQFYVGAGLHAGAYRGRYYYDVAYRQKGKKYEVYRYYYYDDKMYPVFGGDFLAGAEYKFDDLPIVVGVDFKPYFDIFDGRTAAYSDGAVSIRFTF